MYHLQISSSSLTAVLILGSVGMLVLTMGLVSFLVMHQRRVLRFNKEMQEVEVAHQRTLLEASVRLQEEERQRIAADLHDDAGPLLATVRLYLNENLVNLDKASQIQSVFQAKQIIDDTILLIRNMSHNLMPPTLKNFGLESAVADLFQKITGSGSINASCRFHDYKERLKEEKELILFRIIQELINNIIKHSNSSFIHLTQNIQEDKFFIRLHHDGKGILQADFDRLNKASTGLGLKNISSRMSLINGKILFEKDISQTYYKVTMELPNQQPFA
ncbi:MAG: hypothetical protein RIR12_2507 [Bacteroidota bacterium]|jgi:two-component system NarL family sensor kinase